MNNTQSIIEELFQEAKNGRILIGKEPDAWTFYTQFFVKIENQNPNAFSQDAPTINIPNYARFLQKTEKYLQVAKQFYSSDQQYYEIDDNQFSKKLVLDMLINCSATDFSNIENYVDAKTKVVVQSQKFLSALGLEDRKPFSKQNLSKQSEPQKDLFLGKFDTGENITKIYASIYKNRSSIESPLVFLPYFQDAQTNTFYMPAIMFGLGTDNLGKKSIYIGAVQNFAEKQDSKFAKKMDRYLRKVNSGVDADSIEYQVSPKAVVSMVMFLEYAKNLGAELLYATDFMPLRYNSKTNSPKCKDADIKEKIDSDQFNQTNRFMYLFERIEHHFKDINLQILEDGCKMDLQFDEPQNSDNIIFDIAQSAKGKWLNNEIPNQNQC